jgi:hypothetical protein
VEAVPGGNMALLLLLLLQKNPRRHHSQRHSTTKSNAFLQSLVSSFEEKRSSRGSMVRSTRRTFNPLNAASVRLRMTGHGFCIGVTMINTTTKEKIVRLETGALIR